MEENVTLIGVNTVYDGRCYTWSMPGIDVSVKERVLKDIYVNLAGNDSNCIAYIYPVAPNFLVAVNRLPFSIEPLKIRNFRFIEIKLSKLIHKTEIGGDEEGEAPCDDSENYTYYEVRYVLILRSPPILIL